MWIFNITPPTRVGAPARGLEASTGWCRCAGAGAPDLASPHALPRRFDSRGCPRVQLRGCYRTCTHDPGACATWSTHRAARPVKPSGCQLLNCVALGNRRAGWPAQVFFMCQRTKLTFERDQPVLRLRANLHHFVRIRAPRGARQSGRSTLQRAAMFSDRLSWPRGSARTQCARRWRGCVFSRQSLSTIHGGVSTCNLQCKVAVGGVLLSSLQAVATG